MNRFAGSKWISTRGLFDCPDDAFHNFSFTVQKTVKVRLSLPTFHLLPLLFRLLLFLRDKFMVSRLIILNFGLYCLAYRF